jgi:2-polyprenyl-6-methoxyphenol hydroxylase-like FAD-dependent oxidoreductase
MKILVYGAGVIGSLYAARLKQIGADVTVLSRGKRLEAIRKFGIELEDVSTGKRSSHQVSTIDASPRRGSSALSAAGAPPPGTWLSMSAAGHRLRGDAASVSALR